MMGLSNIVTREVPLMSRIVVVKRFTYLYFFLFHLKKGKFLQCSTRCNFKNNKWFEGTLVFIVLTIVEVADS